MQIDDGMLVVERTSKSYERARRWLQARRFIEQQLLSSKTLGASDGACIASCLDEMLRVHSELFECKDGTTHGLFWQDLAFDEVDRDACYVKTSVQLSLLGFGEGVHVEAEDANRLGSGQFVQSIFGVSGA